MNETNQFTFIFKFFKLLFIFLVVIAILGTPLLMAYCNCNCNKIIRTKRVINILFEVWPLPINDGILFRQLFPVK